MRLNSLKGGVHEGGGEGVRCSSIRCWEVLRYLLH
jgi:hypothetical protein